MTAVTVEAKTEQVRNLGAHRVIDRNADLALSLGENSVDVVIDNVAGPNFEALLNVLKRGGIYASSGAIAGPIVTLDMRNFYLKDLSLIGCTAWDATVFSNLIGYIEGGELQPLVSKVFPLETIAQAQSEFLMKKHLGNFVLIPPPLDD